MNLLEETKLLMKKYKIKANKNLGQNFLIDDEVINDIVNGADIGEDDLVIEIGPGLGSMTKLLLEKAKKVICIELDTKMIKILNDRFIAYNNIELINDDVLKIDLNKLINAEKENNKIKDVKIVANLPYYITTPIIMKLLENNLDIKSITVMIQKEVADRLIETPSGKNTGAITYTVYYYCKSKKIREVENTAFMPMPEVTSEVINLELRDEPAVNVKDKKIFFNIIKSSYMQRRKTLLNALVNTGVFKNKEEGVGMLKTLNLKEDVRAENLTIEDFARLTNLFCEKL
jgi:16S rRNA (adenine1518-N6/adenine1519-N6)-dimethyltransferase